MRRFRFTAYVTSFLYAAAAALTGAGVAQSADSAAATGYVALDDSYSSGVGSGTSGMGPGASSSVSPR